MLLVSHMLGSGEKHLPRRHEGHQSWPCQEFHHVRLRRTVLNRLADVRRWDFPKSPNPKHQIMDKFQAPNHQITIKSKLPMKEYPKGNPRHWDLSILVIGACLKFGTCDLVLTLLFLEMIHPGFRTVWLHYNAPAGYPSSVQGAPLSMRLSRSQHSRWKPELRYRHLQ